MTAPTLPRSDAVVAQNAAARADRELPRGEAKRRAVREMFDSIAARYELVNTLTSFGLDRVWRRRCLDALELPPGSRVLDVGCGTGDLSRGLVHLGHLPVGLDMSPGMLVAGARTHGSTTPLVLGDALAAPFPDASFDGAVSGFALRNLVDLVGFFRELARLVTAGGRICLLDLGTPEARALRWGHHVWCNRGVPLLGSLLSDRDAYRYLPRSFAYLPPAEEAVGLLGEAGFIAVEHELLNGGIAQLFVATRGKAE